MSSSDLDHSDCSVKIKPKGDKNESKETIRAIIKFQRRKRVYGAT